VSGKKSHNRAAVLGELRPLSAGSFPKRCRTCGAVFQSAAVFIDHTSALSGGTIKVIDDDEGRFLELYRNCSCGSTLMDFFADRRDYSPAGDRRRQQFVTLLQRLEGQGFSAQQSRAELLNYLRGEPCPLLDRLLPQAP